MASKSSVFDETYRHYLSQIAGIDLAGCRDMLGFELDGEQAVIPFFDEPYRVSSGGVYDTQGQTPHLSICVVLFKYLLMCPDRIRPEAGLAAYKDFKDAGPLIQFFSNTVEGDVARAFSGNASGLDRACRDLGGEPYGEDLGYQVKYLFNGLPRIPVFLLFNDREEGFAAQCRILFESRAETFLDMESVAMLGGRLSQRLSSLAAG